MKKLLNTVYVSTPEAALRREGENLVVEVERSERLRVPLHMIASVVAFGPVLLTPGLIAACASHGITVALCDRTGRFLARVEGPVNGNVLLRREQYRIADDDDRHVGIVKAILLGKVSNQRQVLVRAIRDHGDSMDAGSTSGLRDAARRLTAVVQRISRAADVATMRGFEGDAARVYFSAFPVLIRSEEPEFTWNGRSRRPPIDRFNALLSFLYTMLTHECRGAAECVGLDPAAGFLHRDRPGRPSLALDMMEELRPVMADRLALSLVNRRQLRASDFRVRESGAVVLSDDARKTVLTAWQDRKRVERQHPFLGESAPHGLVPYVQAQLLARHIRGDLDGYPPWLWR